MRILLTTIILTLLSQPVWAINNGDLFRDCKPFANNGYSVDGLSEKQMVDALTCLGFFSGVMHHAQAVCAVSPDKKHKLLFGTSIEKPEVLTQKFLNWAEANPEKWEYSVYPSYWILNTC